MGQSAALTIFDAAPNAYTHAQRERIIEKCLNGYKALGTFAGACKFGGISRPTLAVWIQQDPSLKKRFNDADEYVTDTLESKAIKMARGGSEKLLVQMLQSRRERYKQKLTIEPSTELNMANVIEAMRQIAIAQPTLKPILVQTLQQAIARIIE